MTLSLWLVYTAAVSCPKLVFRVLNTTHTVIGTVVNVTCRDGQKLTTGHAAMTTGHAVMITCCSRLGRWVPEIPECVGKSYV